MAQPIVYCETNWVVALAFQHDQLHEAAVQLKDEALAGRYEIRVPDAALLEPLASQSALVFTREKPVSDFNRKPLGKV